MWSDSKYMAKYWYLTAISDLWKLAYFPYSDLIVWCSRDFIKMGDKKRFMLQFVWGQMLIFCIYTHGVHRSYKGYIMTRVDIKGYIGTPAT